MLAAGNLCRSGNFVCRVLRVARIMETFQPPVKVIDKVIMEPLERNHLEGVACPWSTPGLVAFRLCLGWVSFAEKPALVKQPQRLIPGSLRDLALGVGHRR